MAEKTIGTLKSNLKSVTDAYNLSASKPTVSDSVSSVLIGYFKDMESAVKNITDSYSSILAYKRKIEEAYVVCSIYQLYGVMFKEKLEAFNQITKLANILKDSASDFNYYVGLIEKALAIYYSEASDSDKGTAKKQIEDCLSRMKEYLSGVISGLSFIPSSTVVDQSSVNDDGTNPIKSDKSKTFSSPADSAVYDIYKADLGMPGYVAEKSTAYIKINDAFNKSDAARDGKSVKAFVSVPLSGMLNQEFFLSSYSFLLFWTMPEYVASYEVDNDGSDSKVTSEKVSKTSVMRFGGVFSQTNVLSDGLSMKYKYDSSQVSWSTGSLKEIGKMTDGGMTLSCGFSGTDSDMRYSNSRLSDSVSATFLASVGSIEYTASGTLDYDKAKSEETMGRSVYSGSITLSGNDQTTSRPVILEIVPSDGKYDITLRLDPSSSVNSSSAISDNVLDVSNLVPALLSRTYKGISMSDSLDTSDAKLKTVQALESISSLSVSDMGSFSDRFSRLKALLDSCESGMDSIVDSALSEMSSAGNTAVSAISVLQSNDSNYDSSGYASDVETSFANLIGGISTYSSVSDDSSDSIYGGTAYSKISGYYDSFSESMNDVITDLIEGEEKLDDLESKILLIADSSVKDADFSSSLTLFSNIVTGVSSTVEAYVASGTKFMKIQIDPYADWIKYFKANVSSSAKASYMEMLYLLSVVNRYNSSHSVYSESTSDSWRSALNGIVANIAMAYCGKIGNPFSITDSVNTIKSGKLDIEMRSGFEYSSDPNKFFTHPMVSKEFPELEKFDYTDVAEMLAKPKTSNSEFFDSWKQIIYSAIISSDGLSGSIERMISLVSDRKLNIREMCLAYSLYLVVDEMRSDGDMSHLITDYDLSKMGALKAWKDTIGEYSDVYRAYKGSDDDLALSYISDGSALQSLIEHGIPED